MPSDPDAAARARIINHMNADHAPELSRYLQHFAKVPPSRASGAVMTDISLSSMTLKDAKAETHVVPFEPAMKSFAEARTRAVSMDAAAREGLGLADVSISSYTPPRGFALFVFCAVAFYFACFFSLPWQVPGSPQRAIWDAVFPGGAAAQEWVVRAIFVPVLGIHFVEILVLERTGVAWYGVRWGSGVWWAWVGSCFFEGYPAFQRFDGMVGEARAAKGKGQ